MERTGITPTAEDFDYIHAVYLNTSMNKDEFCKDFKKHGDSRIIRDVHVRVLNYEMKCERQKEVIDNLTDFLIGKAHAYDDTDFRKEAVGLVGEMEVVKRTIELGLPLWDEDRPPNRMRTFITGVLAGLLAGVLLTIKLYKR